MKDPIKDKEALEKILLHVFGKELNNFYLSDNGSGRLILKTSKKYKKEKNAIHPLQAMGREIMFNYYRFGAAVVGDLINRGEFKKE